MADQIERIDAALAAWIRAQPVVFVATAPSGSDGLVNCSPKGGDSVRVLDDETVAYLDLTGSGVETIAHVRQNARIVLMWCAFDGPPRIVRVHGQGEVAVPGTALFDRLVAQFDDSPGIRSVIRVRASRISTSCGYGVPLMDFKAPREVLTMWAEKRGTDGLREYQKTRNAKSLDGLPGVDWID